METQNSRKIKEKRGITLIALVITIIVLLILAGISISMLVGEGGILTNAIEARDKTNIQDIIEQAQMDILAKLLEKNGNDIAENELKAILEKYGKLEGEEGQSILDQTLKTDKGDITVSDIYSGKVKERGLTADEIYNKRESYYGKCVDYPIDINGDGKTEKDWKIFYVEDYQGETDVSTYYQTQQSKDSKLATGKRIFLIAADCVGNKCDALTNKDIGALKKSGMTESTSYRCTYYWNSPSDYTYDCTLPKNASADKEACEFPSLFEFTECDIEGHKENPNSLLASSLLCTENWQSFVNDTYADFAIGGPTEKMFDDSVGDERDNRISQLYSPHFDIYVNNQFFKFDLNNDGKEESCWGYWFGTPDMDSTDQMKYCTPIRRNKPVDLMIFTPM